MAKRYKLSDLIDECDLSQETSEELKEWENAPSVGREEDWGQFGVDG